MSTNHVVFSSFLHYPWRWLAALLIAACLALPLAPESQFELDEPLPHLAGGTQDANTGG